MKDIPSVKQKLGKKRSKQKIFHDSDKRNENSINDSAESKKKKKVKKIKSRLADPNIPDFYICEVFDSSLEREEEEERQKEEKEDVEFRGRDKSKQRNFFDVLMSKDSRRNFTINSAVENEEIPEETKLFREVESDDVVQKRKSTKAKNKGKLVELINRKNKKKINGYCSSTSDDESLFEIQSSLKFFTTKEKNPPNSENKLKNKENTAFHCEDDSDPAKSSIKSLLPKSKNTNILSYFSVTETRGIGNRVKPRKESCTLKPRKLTEINMFENIRKEDSSSTREGDDKEKKPESVKLAPLFQKKVKPVIDPKVQKARMDFLQNGLPTNFKKTGEIKKNMDDKYPGINFPDVAHVQQKDDDPLWCSEVVSIPMLKTEETYGYNCKEKTFRFQINQEEISSEKVEQASQSSLNSLRLRYSGLNIETIFNGFKEKKSNYMKKVEECVRDDDSDDSVEIIRDCEVGDGCYSLWTEVYRPKSDEILGNKQTVARLSGWLKSWKEYNIEIKSSNARNRTKTLTESDDSNDDFVSSDTDGCSVRSPVNICLLSGPIASGKTALVYALASEFDYNVLEVNSSSRRTGKKLLLDLQEATKSHQVSSGFNTAPAEDKEKQLKTKKKKKRKRKVAADSNAPNNSKMSLILIEDADIFFDDHDEGFVTAISTLVQSSKRPFIFLSNDPNYGYFERLKQQQILLLKMRRPNFQNACAVLDVIAAVEGVSLDKETLGNLIQGNEYDLRKSILELQFWVLSGKKLIRGVGNECELGKLWWGFNKFLYKKDNAHVVKLEYRKRKRSSELYDSSEDETEEASKKAKLNAGIAKAAKSTTAERKYDSSIHAYTRILDSVSVSDLFKCSSDLEPIPRNECRPKDGLSLRECMESVDWKAKDLSGLIMKELVNVSARVFASSDGRSTDCVLSNPSWSEIRWRNLQHDAKQCLVTLVPSNGGNSKRSINLDYLPVLRNMCRAEKSRYMGNTKRKNRFNHYFRTLGCEPRDESLEISCDIFNF